MKNSFRSILSLCALSFVFQPYSLEAAERATVTQLVSSRNQVEFLRGAAALTHLKNLKVRRSQAFAMATGLMQERGFRPTDTVTVIRSTSLVHGRGSVTRPDIQRVQTSASDDSGEVVFWSWNDGNDATWEGVVYFEDYATGANFTGNAQIDVSQEQESVIWEQQVSYSSGGGGTDKKYTRLSPFGNGREVARLASVSGDAVAEVAGRPPIFLTQTGARVANFLICFSSRCYVHMMQCRWTGPYWADCSMALCGADAIICGVGALK